VDNTTANRLWTRKIARKLVDRLNLCILAYYKQYMESQTDFYASYVPFVIWNVNDDATNV
jgi:hypothetical protein